VDIDAGGDASYAVQIQATKTFEGQSATVAAHFTLVFAHKGRVVYEISSRATGAAHDPEEMSAFAESAAARIRQE
jgi:hypothetical protein